MQKNIKPVLKNSFDLLAHIFTPDTCLHCGIDTAFDYKRPLCVNCETKLELMPKLQCKRCGVVLTAGGGYCHRCAGYKAHRYKCSLIRSALVFNPQIRSVIHHFKYRQKTKLAKYLAEFLADAFKRYDEICDCEIILPVAVSPSKLKMRGFNQAFLLAGELSRKTAIGTFDDILVKTKHTKSQAELKREERQENVKDAFDILHPEIVKAKNILLIDDVATTAATLEACAAALKKAGAKSVRALTVARE